MGGLANLAREKSYYSRLNLLRKDLSRFRELNSRYQDRADQIWRDIADEIKRGRPPDLKKYSERLLELKLLELRQEAHLDVDTTL